MKRKENGLDLKISIDVFSLPFWKFIFSSFFVFCGFCIILLILKGLWKFSIKGIKEFFSKFRKVYQNKIQETRLENEMLKNRPSFLNKLDKTENKLKNK